MYHAMPFSALKNIFFDADIVVKKTNRMWLIFVCTHIYYVMRHPRGQNLL